MRTSGAPDAAFLVPSFSAPVDADAALRDIPESATISGMFLLPLAQEARRLGKPLPSARERYVPFQFYPLREHAKLLLETCRLLYPDRPARQALRKLGRGAPKALVASTLGKVVLGSVEGPHDVIAAMAKAYPLNARPSQVTVLESSRGRSVVRLEEVHYFLDSHHVGAFEGVLNFAGVKGRVLFARRGRAAGDLLLEWSDE
ncbi:MAG TPA: DUF2378 family protein [Polyangiaceae bacterium]|nr:DUF2378 family protein [Polyangiaceae bacterium]